MRKLVQSARRLLGIDGKSEDLEGWVARAANELVMRDNQDEIESALVEAGATPGFALKLVLLIPSAFAREHFSGDGIEFPETFLIGPVENFEERHYSEEPVYVAARSLARCWLAEGKGSMISRIVECRAHTGTRIDF